MGNIKTSKKPQGRPQVKINPDDVRSLASEGLTDKQIASRLGISRATLHTRKKDTPEILEAYQLGEAEAIAVIEKTLFSAAMCGDVGACKFILATRRRETYSQRQEITGADGGEIQIAARPMTPAERLKAVVDVRKALEAEY